jgi:hypothetical protein
MNINEVISQLPRPATPDLIDRAKQFVLRKPQERAMERGYSEVPADLSNACKFASLFAQRIFGGQRRGNWDHQYLVLPNGQPLGLTELSQTSLTFARKAAILTGMIPGFEATATTKNPCLPANHE